MPSAMTGTAPLHYATAVVFALHVVSFHLTTAQSLPGDIGTVIMGYTFETNVSQHARIDLDQATMEKKTDEFKWAEASTIYRSGENSMKENEKRTLAGFSTKLEGKMNNEGYFRLYKAYWGGHEDYADRFVQSGLGGTGDIEGKSNKFRAEIANKGSQYQNVWMYVIHEMEDAIDDCAKNSPTDNDDPDVKAWDEAWAFYTGSLLGNLSTAKSGKLLYTLAQLRCGDFDTCETLPSTDSIANVNNRALQLFKRGKSELNARSCDAAVKTKNEIVKLMTVPLMQGTIRYVYKAKTDVGDEKQKSHAEGWAFAAAMLPIVNYCDGGVAELLHKNLEPKADPMSDEPADVVRKLSTVYRCLGFSCDDVGKRIDPMQAYPECKATGPQFKAIPGTGNPAVRNQESVFSGLPTGPSGSSGLSGGAIAGIIIGVIVAVAVVVGVFFYRKSKSPKVLPIQAEVDSVPGEFS